VTTFTHDKTLSSRTTPLDERQPALCLPAAVDPADDADDADDLLEEILWVSGTCSFHDIGSSTTQVEEDSRYTGPSSGLSVLSTPILSCTSKNIREFGGYDFRKKIDLCQMSLWKIQQRVQKLPERSMYLPNLLTTPLPPDDVAAGYINEYFNTCQNVFPIVQRKSFEMAWKKSLEHPEIFDISWYTLQNAVLAMGAFTSKSASSPASYRGAKEEALGYFNNALNITASLLRTQTSLMVIQAFCVLSMFTSIVGDYNLGNMCTSFATQLAQIKGLHKLAADHAALNPVHRTERERLFWIVYFFDKMNSLSTGLPSHIDDGDISCSFPELNEIDSEDFSAGSGELLLNLVRFTHICSKIKTRLYSATALNKDVKQLLHVRDALCQDLSNWRDQIPAIYLAKSTPFRISSLPPHTKPVRAVLLRIAYQYALCTIHRRFFSLFAKCARTETGSLGYHQSDSEFLKAARELILLLDQVEMDVDAPNWFFAYQLLTAVVPLFIYVVANPLDPSAKDDIALMNVATGVFGRLEFITSGDFAFEGGTEFAPLATGIVEKAQQHLGIGHENIWRADGLDLDAVYAFSLDSFPQIQDTGSMEGLSASFTPGELESFLGFNEAPFE
jgi:Fungal specific transcription factor domain